MNIGHNGTPGFNFLFINGKGASGKDTQAEKIIDDDPLAVRISTGDLFRAISKDTEHPLHDLVAPHAEAANKGAYLPNDVIMEMVNFAVAQKIEEGKREFIFTGFPRTEEQLTALDNFLDEFGQKAEEEMGLTTTSKFIHYAISDETSRERAAYRRNLHITKRDDVRRDDQEDVVNQRLATYKELTQPMIDRLLDEGRLVNISAEGPITVVTELTNIALGFNRSLSEGRYMPVEAAQPLQPQEEPLTPPRPFAERR